MGQKLGKTGIICQRDNITWTRKVRFREKGKKDEEKRENKKRGGRGYAKKRRLYNK